jgi:hypothetical protein
MAPPAGQTIFPQNQVSFKIQISILRWKQLSSFPTGKKLSTMPQGDFCVTAAAQRGWGAITEPVEPAFHPKHCKKEKENQNTVLK